MVMTKEDILNSLRKYKESIDDDNIYFKELIKKTLLKSDKLIYVLNNKELLDAEAGNDEYFNISIFPYLKVPEIDSKVSNFLCYSTSFESNSNQNKLMKYGTIVFEILCNFENAIDNETGITRHDLIGSIIRELFNWTNIFGNQIMLVANVESTVNDKFSKRTLVFEITNNNGIYKDQKVINSIVRTE